MSERRIPITLAGQELVLFYEVNVVSDLEDEYDLNMSVTKCLQEGRFSHGFLRALLSAGLSHGKKKVTRPAAGLLMQQHMDTGGSLGEIADGVVQALIASGIYGTSDEKNDDAPVQPAHANGEAKPESA